VLAFAAIDNSKAEFLVDARAKAGKARRRRAIMTPQKSLLFPLESLIFARLCHYEHIQTKVQRP